MGGNGHGARDQDAISILILIFMSFVILEWLTNAAFSPFPSSWQGKSCVASSAIICYGAVSSDISAVVALSVPLLIIAVPLVFAMFGFYLMKELGGVDPKDYFEMEILRTRALITANDQMELNRLSAVESAASTRAEKNAAIKAYNAKVDEINVRRRKATGKPVTGQEIRDAVPKDRTTPKDLTTARHNKEVEEENAEKVEKEKMEREEE
jgi:hypothetical protein